MVRICKRSCKQQRNSFLAEWNVAVIVPSFIWCSLNVIVRTLCYLLLNLVLPLLKKTAIYLTKIVAQYGMSLLTLAIRVAVQYATRMLPILIVNVVLTRYPLVSRRNGG